MINEQVYDIPNQINWVASGDSDQQGHKCSLMRSSFPLCINDVPIATHLVTNKNSGPKVIKLFFMLNSAEHEIYPAHKC